MSIVNIANNESASSVRGKLNATIDAVNGLTRNSNITVTVGSGGDVATINEAMVEISKFKIIHRANPVLAQINILAGFQMQEQLLIDGSDYGWVTISSEDSAVVVNRASLSIDFTNALYGFSSFPAFGVRNGGSLPVINSIFEMNSSGTGTNRSGVVVIGAGSCCNFADNAGFNNAASNNIFVTQGGIFTGRNCEYNGALQGSISASNLANISIGNSQVKGWTSYGVQARRGCIIDVRNCDCRVAFSTSVNDIKVLEGSIISANTALGGVNQTVNTITSDGIIFR